ncbi:hypothetical protein HDU93_004237 [Gonapodya sp. JEL0774]|nr:hypothetical protein HDU93_004237 [Gonapodya sp. JEL0774]
MWGLTLAYGTVTTDIRFKGRKMDLPLVALGAALLFALPNIRNAAPNTPPIGTQLDMGTLFFSIVVVGVCLIVNIFRVVWEISPPAQPKPSVDKEPVEKPRLPEFTASMASGGRYGAEEIIPLVANMETSVPR